MDIVNLTFGYPDNPIFDHLHFTIPEGEITAILGASGVGKTTLLHLLAGLRAPHEGEIPPRKVSYIFQEPRLMPAVTVLQNICLSAHVDEAKARAWLAAVGLSDSADKYPRELSGGMADRVSMARAFAHGGDLLLMDEAFKGADIALKEKLYALFLDLWERTHCTTVLVTHSPREACRLAHHIVLLTSADIRIADPGITEDALSTWLTELV